MANPIVENFREGELRSRRSHLAMYIRSRAKVIDARTGYVSIEEVNQRTDPMILQASAEITKGLFLDKLPADFKPEVVIGVPNRGKSFSVALGINTGLPISETDRTLIKDDQNKDFNVEYDQKENTVYINGIPSFTRKGELFSHKLRGVRPDSAVLVADDFCATGAVTEYYLKAFEELNIKPIFVYIVAKDFNDSDPPQKGYRKFKEENLPVFAIVRLTEIENSHVVVTADDILTS